MMVWASSLVIAHKYAHFLFGWITFLIVTYGWITCQGMCNLWVLEALQVAYIACINEVTDDIVAIDALPCASIVGVR
jgi:hypothetical protein